MREEGGTFQELRAERAAQAVEDTRVRGATPELVARNSGQILDLALDLARGRLGQYVLAAFCVWLVARTLQQLTGYTDLIHQLPLTRPSTALGVSLANAAMWFAVDRVAVLAIVVFAWPAVTGVPMSLGASVTRILAGAVPVFLGFALLGIGIIAALGCTCGVAGVWLIWKSSVAPLVYALERTGLGTSLQRSIRLTSLGGTSWEAFAGFLRFVAVYGTSIALATSFGTIAGLVDQPEIHVSLRDALGLPGWAFAAITIVVTAFFNALSSVITGLALLAYYVDCRVRRDGLDLRVRLAELAPPAGAATPAGAAR